MKGTWQTTDGGGDGLAVALVIGAAVLAAAIAGPVAAAVGELLRAVVIILGVVAVLALAAGAAVMAHRLRPGRPVRSSSQNLIKERAGQRVIAPREHEVRLPRSGTMRALGPSPGRGTGADRSQGRSHNFDHGELHLHFHGVTAEDVAAIIAEQDRRRL